MELFAYGAVSTCLGPMMQKNPHSLVEDHDEAVARLFQCAEGVQIMLQATDATLSRQVGYALTFTGCRAPSALGLEAALRGLAWVRSVRWHRYRPSERTA